MWLATTLGFYSAVLAQKPDGSRDPNLVMIRARDRNHLTALKKRFAAELRDCEILETSHTDYRWRIVCPKPVWVKCLAGFGENVDYGNFKDACARRHGHGSSYLDALHRVWWELLKLQEV